MQSHIGEKFNDQDIKDYLWTTLKGGQVVPGYGHGVLRQPDPRFKTLIEWGAARDEVAADPLFQLVKRNSEIAPGVLKEHGKVRSFGFLSLSVMMLLSLTLPRPPARQRIPSPTSTPPRACCSTTTASRRRCTTLPSLASAARWARWRSSSGPARWACRLSAQRASTWRAC